MGEMVDWFKTMTTNDYIRGVKNQGWKRFNGKLWQTQLLGTYHQGRWFLFPDCSLYFTFFKSCKLGE